MVRHANPNRSGQSDHDDGASKAQSEDLQKAIELFVEQHGIGKSPDLGEFAARYPKSIRPQILANCSEFLSFDRMLGHQEWQTPTVESENGRSFGDFLIKEELGRGGMGIVYLAEQKSLKRRVALKVMASGLTLSKLHVSRFRQEAMATAQLSHRAIVPVYSLIEVDGTFALAMEYIAGRNLADMLEDLRLANREGDGVTVGTLGIAPEKGYVAECAMLVAEVASALAIAHQDNIIHRDIKPRNLMIDDKRQIRLLDFGLAKSLDAGRASLSTTNDITGTAHYISPEQALAKRGEVDQRADIWSLGVILYEILTLTRPFIGKNIQQIAHAICFKEPVAIQLRNAKVPRDLATICQKALEKDPSKRYQTAEDLEADLMRFLRWEPIHAKPASAWTRAVKFLRRHRRESLLTALMIVAVTTVSTIMWIRDTVNASIADKLLLTAEARADESDFLGAIYLTEQAMELRNNATTRKQLDRYHQESNLEQKLVLSMCTKSEQLRHHDREEALRVALEANQRQPIAMTRSAVLNALGNGWAVHNLPTPERASNAAWSPTGDHVVLASRSGALSIFQSDKDTKPVTLAGHRKSSYIAGVAYANDNVIVSAATDQTLRLWSLSPERKHQTVALHGLASLLRLSSDGSKALVVTAQLPSNPTTNSIQGSLYAAQVWNTSDGTPATAPILHKNRILAAAISPDGRTMATCTASNSGAQLWRVSDGTEITRCSEAGSGGSALPQIAFTPDSSICAIGNATGSTFLYRSSDGAHIGTIKHSGAITSIDFDPNSKRMLTGSTDQTARIWSLDRSKTSGDKLTVQPREIGVLLGHSSPITQVLFDTEGQLAATATKQPDSTIRVFDVGSGRPPQSSSIYRYEVGHNVRQLQFAKDSKRILALTDNRAMIWDFGLARGVVTLRQPGKVPAIALSGDSSHIATAGDDERLRLWHMRDGRQKWVSERLGNPILALDIASDDRLIACSDVGGVVHVHNMKDGSPKFQLHGHGARVPVVHFLNDQNLLLTAGSHQADSKSGRVTLWGLDDQSVVGFIDRPRIIKSADVNLSNTLLATVEDGDREVRVWKLPRMESHQVIGDHRDTIRAVRFAPDGKSLVTASNDQTAKIYGLNGDCIAVMEVRRPVRFAAFSPSGEYVLTGSLGNGGTAQIWQTKDSQEVLHFDGHRSTLMSGSIDSTGSLAVTSARDGTTCIWPIDPVGVARQLSNKTNQSAITPARSPERPQPLKTR